ncbi:MAG TPA: hypothetical protein VM869_15550 [Enhygromyxa sp.]|nr:hypothetical protein [Enhygromyxa sp.]
MPTPTRLALLLTLISTLACGSEKHEGDAKQAEVELGRASRVSPGEAEPEPAKAKPEPATVDAVEPEPAAEVGPEPELDDRKLALANVGRSAFDALKAGDFDALAQLTPLDEGPLRDACPRMSLTNRQELEARFEHCHRTIRWDAIAEAQVFAGQPSGAQAIGCEKGIEDYGRLQLFLHMNDDKIWRVDFFGAVGQGGNAVGINGEVSCKEVDEAPPLK